MRLQTFIITMVTLTTLSGPLQAEERPFLFTQATTENQEHPYSVHFDTGYGHKDYQSVGGESIEQNLGFQVNASRRLTVVGRVGLLFDQSSTNALGQGEVLVNILNSENHGIDLSAGPGMLHEYGGTNVALGRLVLGRRLDSWQWYGNLLLEKPFATGRDAVDLITTLGASYRVARSFRIGVEGLGQDLEGFWDPTEAEGGARLYAGPLVGIGSSGSPWEFTLGGGPIFRASQSPRVSAAVRDVPFAGETGYLVRSMVTFRL